MDDQVNAQEVAGQLSSSNWTILLAVAIGLGIVFMVVMIFDHIRRKRNAHKYRSHHGGFARTLTRPFRRVRAVWHALKELRERRAQRRAWGQSRRHRSSGGGHRLRSHRHARHG